MLTNEVQVFSNKQEAEHLTTGDDDDDAQDVNK